MCSSAADLMVARLQAIRLRHVTVATCRHLPPIINHFSISSERIVFPANAEADVAAGMASPSTLMRMSSICESRYPR